jgi:hypothetical protein
MQPEPGSLEQVHGPVPAVGRLDHHLGIRTRLAHHLEQRHRVVGDSHAVELLAVAVHRVDHRAATVQVDTDVRSLHRGLPSSKEDLVCEARVSTDSVPHGERRPRSFIASHRACAAASRTGNRCVRGRRSVEHSYVKSLLSGTAATVAGCRQTLGRRVPLRCRAVRLCRWQ